MSAVPIFPGLNCRGPIVPGSIVCRPNRPGFDCLWAQFSWAQLSMGAIVVGPIVCGPNCQGPIVRAQLSGPNCQGPIADAPYKIIKISAVDFINGSTDVSNTFLKSFNYLAAELEHFLTM